MEAILDQNRITEITVSRNAQTLGEKVGLFGKIFGCWHKHLSRPFSDKNTSYRACLECGARKQFNAETLKSSGSFYYPPAVSFEISRTGGKSPR
jgi:hypothetical protein